MPPKSPKAVSIDNIDIDFSGVAHSTVNKKPSTAGSSSVPTTVDILSSAAGSGGGKPEEQKAFDPLMQKVAAKSALAAGRGRRRALFQNTGTYSTVGGGSTGDGTAADATTAEERKQLEALKKQSEDNARQIMTQVAQEEAHAKDKKSELASFQERKDLYVASLKSFCGHTPNSTNGYRYSLLKDLFEDGVPDVEPWDRWLFNVPRYDTKGLVAHVSAAATAKHKGSEADAAAVDVLHHPTLAPSYYTSAYEMPQAAMGPPPEKYYKTKEELRQERKDRLKDKQERLRREREEANQHGRTSKVAGGALVSSHDRLSNKNLTHNLASFNVLNPVAADTMVFDQYAQRYLDHQKRNYEQHMAALPNQIAKRQRDKQRHAREAPLLVAYRIFPIFNPAQLLRLQDFANDHLLRGCILYVQRCDAVVVLSGGRHAMRDLQRWITAKMRWEHPETRATLLCHVPLPDAHCFSFHLRSARAKGEDGGGAVAKERKTETERQHAKSFQRAERHTALTGEEEEDSEPVFMTMEDTVKEGFAFLAQMPASDRALWPDLTSVWRAAFLATGTSS